MDNKKTQFNFLLIFLVAAFILAIFIFRPFIYALILAVIFAVVFQPVYRKILKLFGQYPRIAALLATILVVIFILAPVALLGFQIFKEARQLYFSLAANGGQETILNIFRNAANKIQHLVPETKDFSLSFDQYVKQGATWLVQNLGAIFSNFAKMIVSSFIFLMAFYYLLKDGEKLKKTIMDISPLSDTDNETIFSKLELAINSVVRGNLVIALVQGVSTAAGFTIFGVPNAVLWGMIAAITALIPGIGTSLVIIPAIAYLFLIGQTISAFGLIVWGVLAVGLIDDFLGPKIVGRGIKLHPLLVILAVLGGIALFGPMGFLLGPLSLSLFFTLLDIYFYLLKKA